MRRIARRGATRDPKAAGTATGVGTTEPDDWSLIGACGFSDRSAACLVVSLTKC